MMNYENMSKVELIDLLRSLRHPTVSRSASSPGKAEPGTDQLHRLLHDLQVYQVELEMQNRELHEARQDLEESRNRYADLYDFAPVGYVSLDRKGCILEINLTGARLLGVERPALIGKPFVHFVDKQDVQNYFDHLKNSLVEKEETSTELNLAPREGESIPVQLITAPKVETPGSQASYRTIITDMSEARKAETQVKASLREKEVLLKEVHHRVKNNLQLISSLLKLQSGYIQDPRALEMFRESQNIVRSMALIHEKLYQSKDLAGIDSSEFVESLATNLFRSYGVNAENISLSVTVDDVVWGIDTAIPCSLIINELLSNALKHAFPGNREGKVRVDLQSTGANEYTLIVADDGIGLPRGFDFRTTETLGLQLVCILTDELEGTISLDRARGTGFRISFSAGNQK